MAVLKEAMDVGHVFHDASWVAHEEDLNHSCGRVQQWDTKAEEELVLVAVISLHYN